MRSFMKRFWPWFGYYLVAYGIIKHDALYASVGAFIVINERLDGEKIYHKTCAKQRTQAKQLIRGRD